jgi:hypothetical protein
MSGMRNTSTPRGGRRGGQTNVVVAKKEVENPNMTLGEVDPRWDDLWTSTTSDDE